MRPQSSGPGRRAFGTGERGTGPLRSGGPIPSSPLAPGGSSSEGLQRPSVRLSATLRKWPSSSQLVQQRGRKQLRCVEASIPVGPDRTPGAAQGRRTDSPSSYRVSSADHAGASETSAESPRSHPSLSQVGRLGFRGQPTGCEDPPRLGRIPKGTSPHHRSRFPRQPRRHPPYRT